MSSHLGFKLPLLPGYSFRDATRSAFHRSQTLGYKAGSPVARPPTVGIGQAALESQELAHQQNTELSFEAAELVYESSRRRSKLQDFVPSYVAFDKKVLRFFAYFKEDVLYSPNEEYRVRPINIYYYLEDDSMELFEPEVENSGLLQGKRIKRHRVLKNDLGQTYNWKDLNLAMDLQVYGVKYRVIQCDAFTKEFMASQGIILNEPEPLPLDPYITRRQAPQPCHQTPSDFDSLNQFLTLDRQVLRFFALWDDPHNRDKKTVHVSIMYYLVDDTVEIREIHEANSGRDPFPILMRRRRLPKHFKADYECFPSCVLEVSSKEVDQYYTPRDFQVGKTVRLLDRRFLLYDCDVFTKNYYLTNHPDMDMKPMELPKEDDDIRNRKREIPPYNGFGSLEDSQQNCLYLIPKPAKKDMIKLLENDHKVLRYSAIMESQDPKERHFILSYYLSDDMISIFERQTANSGMIGGKFLKKTRIPKPGSTVENPEFYSPADFAIGATLSIFSYRFVLTDADHYVLKYLESIADQIPTETLDSVRQRLGVATTASQEADQNDHNEVGEPSLDYTGRDITPADVIQ